jgi:hypothetical protein
MYRNFSAATIILGLFGLGACSSSNNTPSNNATGGGGGTSENGTGGSGGLSAAAGGAAGGTNASGTGGGATASCHAAGTFTVTNQATTAYVIDGVANPTLTLCRGSTYTFALNASGHPFYIKTVQGTGAGNAYDTGVTGNGLDSGNVIFTVGSTAPNTLFYDCSLHPAMTGTINIVN